MIQRLILGVSLTLALLSSCGPGGLTFTPGTGLKAEYYDELEFAGARVVQIDPQIDFDWASNSPTPGIAAETFSVQWSGEILTPYGEEYTFYTTTDDGVRLYVNNQTLVSQWNEQSSATFSGKITLEAGKRYPIRLEYYENGGVASAKLEWSSPTIARQVIPAKYLYPAP
jgi:hypothetical protein